MTSKCHNHRPQTKGSPRKRHSTIQTTRQEGRNYNSKYCISKRGSNTKPQQTMGAKINNEPETRDRSGWA